MSYEKTDGSRIDVAVTPGCGGWTLSEVDDGGVKELVSETDITGGLVYK